MRSRYLSALILIAMSAVLLEGFARIHPRVVPHRANPAENSMAAVDLRADRLHAVYAHEGKVYAIEDHFVYVSADTGASWRQLGALPKPEARSIRARLRETIARSGLTRRYRRYEGPKSLLVLASGTILVFYDRIYRSADGGATFHVVHGTEPVEIPFGFPSSVGYTRTPGDTVYFGEYRTDDRPHPVRIVRGIDDGQRWEIAHTFQDGDLFHVHSITFDEHRDGLWVATGDDGDEARLLFTPDHFQTLRTVGCCTQDWRLVDLVVTEEALYWGSDDNRERPGIFRYDVRANALERMIDIDNPSYHAARLADGSIAISTTYEPRSPFTKNKRPPASTSIWWSRDGRAWHRLLERPVDSVRAAEGRRAQIQLPGGDPLPALFATPWNTERDDFVTLRFKLTR